MVKSQVSGDRISALAHTKQSYTCMLLIHESSDLETPMDSWNHGYGWSLSLPFGSCGGEGSPASLPSRGASKLSSGCPYMASDRIRLSLAAPNIWHLVLVWWRKVWDFTGSPNDLQGIKTVISSFSVIQPNWKLEPSAHKAKVIYHWAAASSNSLALCKWQGSTLLGNIEQH